MAEYDTKAYYQNLNSAGSYAAQYHEPTNLRTLPARIIGAFEKKLYARMLNQLEIPKGKVLDIASGTGRFAEILLNDGHQVGGIDISTEMLGHARQRLGSHANLRFLQKGDAGNLDFDDNQFDLVSCMRLFHLVPLDALRPMLKEVRRVGKGEAVVFFGVTNGWLSLRQAVRDKLVSGRKSCPHALTMAQIKQEVEDAGMQIKDQARVLSLVSGGLVALVTWDNDEPHPRPSA